MRREESGRIGQKRRGGERKEKDQEILAGHRMGERKEEIRIKKDKYKTEIRERITKD